MARVRRHQDQRGVALVEFAFVLPVLLLIAFATIDFTSALASQNSLRQGTREGTRNGVVNDFGTDTSCTVTGSAPANNTTKALVCRVKNRVGLPQSNVRVKLDWPGGNTSGESLVICSEYPMQSTSKVYSFLMSGRTFRTKVEMRIESTDSALTPYAETSLGSSWSWC